jgi:hypothetical protein
MPVYDELSYLDLLECEEDLAAYEASGQAEADREAAEAAAWEAMCQAADMDRLTRTCPEQGFTTEREMVEALGLAA